MSTKVVNIRREKFDIYIGRGSKWGNPFTHLNLVKTKAKFKVSTREESISKYKSYLMESEELMSSIYELKGKILGCYCKPNLCHGDILAEFADSV